MALSNDVEPLYLKHSDLPTKDLKAYDICLAMSNKIGAGKVDGAQRIKNIWRLYLKDNKSRNDLFTKQTIIVGGKIIHIFDKNPATQQQSMNRPLNIPNDDIKKELESIGEVFLT